MGIKIYTYKDPFHIDKYSYWEDIKEYPHLCVSQTLVQGLTRKYKRDQFTYIYCIDDIIENLYYDWIKSTENRVNQYLKISEEIEKISNPKTKRSFKFNQNKVLDSIRMIKELDFKLYTDKEELPLEQNWLIHIMNKVENEDCFKVIDRYKTIDKNKLIQVLNNKLIEEKEKFEKELELYNLRSNERQKERKQELQKFIKNTCKILDNKNKATVEKIVIHGIHRFDSKLFYFIRHMKSLGIDIIFLINYNEDYKRIYETWSRVYKWTNKEFNIEEIDIEEYYSDLGIAIGKLLEGDFESINECGLNTYKVNIFENMTEFSNSICQVYEKAQSELKSNPKNSSGSILNKMRTQYYAVNNRDINEILKTYYPEQFGEKHFLAYPIGQFILGIYNMWDSEKERIIIDESSIKECLTISFWNNKTKSSLVEIYDKVKLYFKDKQDIEEIIIRLDSLINNISNIQKDIEYKYMKKLSFYVVSIEEVELLKNVLDSIKTIGNKIFKDTKVKKDKISYKNHYINLLKIINGKVNNSDIVNEKEREFINELQEKLSSIKGEEIEGRIEDITQTLYFYLNMPSSEQQSKWIVRNFEQVDGGVLLSESARSDKKYHYCLVSDKMMNPKLNDLLPWPIDITMLEHFNKDNKYLDAMLTSLKEYKHFLRYSLFYGALFCKQDIEVSYVKDFGDDQDQNLYFILDMLGIKSENEAPTIDCNIKYNENIIHTRINKFEDPSKVELQKASVCMYRYMLDHLIDENMYFSNEYQIKYYTIILMFSDIIKKLKVINFKNINEMIVESEVQKTIEKYRIYLEFFDEVDIRDISTKVKKDVIDYISECYLNNEDEYIDKKLEFLMASIKDIGDEYNDENLIKSIHYSSLNNKNILKYLGHYDMKYEAVNPLICEYCAQREVCLNSFEAN